jgi:hypothetical protein
MHRRFLFFLAACLCAAALGTGPPGANAAIRVTIEDGNPADTRVFLFPDIAGREVGGQTGLFVMDGVEIFASTTTSNLPTSTSVGSLNTTVNITDINETSASLLPTFTVTAQFVDALGNPLLFTGPSGATLTVKSDADASETSDTVLSGFVQNRTTVNGFDVNSQNVALTGGPTEGDVTANVPNPLNAYTLQSVVTISGLNVGASVGVSAASSVIGTPTPIPGPVPEPSSMAIVGLGSLGLGFVASRRRKLLKAQQ